MLLAIAEAEKSKEFVGCGVVIAKDGEVIAKTFNRQRELNNATAHAEMLAIGEAGKKLGNKNLSECTAFCTCEPCTMCLSAMIFAQIPKLYFGTTMQETFPDNLPIRLSSKELFDTAPHKIEVIEGFMRENCLSLLNYSAT